MVCVFFSIDLAHAVWFDSLIYEVPPEKEYISWPVTNNSIKTNLYSVSAYKIDKPGKTGENRIDSNSQEILWSPLKFTASPNEVDYFKFYYKGPTDDKERYYRVVFREAPVQLFPLLETHRNINLTPITAISMLLIVRPRISRMSFSIDEKKGLIKNTGNTYFRVIINQGCNGDDEKSTQFYMLPGEEFHNNRVSVQNKKFIVFLSQYIKLGEGCFQ
ncbi:molecular chaperone [Klebsiella sp. S69]|nr:molecular chaperone [Klebsiella sp. S69]